MRTMDFGRPVRTPAVESRTTDERIADEARRRLCSSSHFHLREMTCDSNCRVLSISGRVPSYYLKQVIQSLLMGIDDVEQLVNDVDVVNVAGLSSVQGKRPREKATEAEQLAARTCRQRRA